MSYELAIINPRKKRRKASKAQIAARKRFVARFAKGRKARRRRKSASLTKSGVSAMAKRKKRRSTRNAKGRFVKRSTRRKAKAAAPRRRRRRAAGKRTPAMGYVVGSRRIRRRKLNPRGRRRRYRRNPILSGGLMGIVRNQLIPAAYGAGGAIALNLALSYLPIPDQLKTGWARHGVRIVGALGIGWLAEKFVKGSAGKSVATGAMVVVMYDIIKAALAQFTPEIGVRLGEFEDVSLNGDGEFYSPAQYVNGYLDGSPGDGDVDLGTGMYMNGDMDGVGMYMQGDI